MQIRDATLDDIPGILAIHNEAVVNTTAIWDEEAADVANRNDWLDDHRRRGYPILVAMTDGRVAGYASYAPWRSKSGYRRTMESSVYVHGDHHRRGVASALMTELIARADRAKVHVMVACIESTNQASIALHERFGFAVVGQMREVGVKFGRMLDLTLMQLTFAEYESPASR